MTVTFEDAVKPTMTKAENPYTEVVKAIAGATVDGLPKTKGFTIEHAKKDADVIKADIAKARRQLTDAAKLASVTVRTKFDTAKDSKTTKVLFWTVAKIARKAKTAEATAANPFS